MLLLKVYILLLFGLVSSQDTTNAINTTVSTSTMTTVITTTIAPKNATELISLDNLKAVMNKVKDLFKAQFAQITLGFGNDSNGTSTVSTLPQSLPELQGR